MPIYEPIGVQYDSLSRSGDQVLLTREVMVNGDKQSVSVCIPDELLRFASPEAKRLVERDFEMEVAEITRNFQPASGPTR